MSINAINSDFPIEVDLGGTGVNTLTAYAVVCGGTTSTGAIQGLASVGTSGQVLKSGGSGALPAFATVDSDYQFQVLSADPSSPSTGQVWYNSTTDLYKGAQEGASAWTVKNSMSTARRLLAAAGTSGSDSINFGGIDSGGDSVVTERFDGTNWTTKGSMNTARSILAGAGTADDALSFGSTVTTERYTGGGTDSWSAKTNMNSSQRQLAGSGSSGNDCLAFGGTSTLTTTERYDGTGNTWTNKTGMNTGRRSLGGGGTAGDAVSFGGNTGSNSAVTELYDGVGNTWTSKTSMNTARREISGCGASSLNILSVGGFVSAASAVTEEYAGGATNTWTTVNSLNTAQDSGSSAGNVSDALYSGGNGPVATTEQFEPSVTIVTFTVT